MRNLFFLSLLGILFTLSSCKKETALQENVLADYIELNIDSELVNDIIACAGGKEGGLFGIANEPTSVFFYPIEGASDFRYFEADIKDSLDFSKYLHKAVDCEPVFNGFLWKFNNLPFFGERMGVVTYRTPGKLHTCTPIRQKTTTKPTEVNPALGMVTENGVNPTFNWVDGLVKENAIYFQVISDEADNLISGTYTFEKEFTFYDLSNVVLNITPTSTPILEPNQNYKFTMMGVSRDNWVNLFIEKEFSTN